MVYAVIMAGGSGTRFWPESKSSRPKQFLELIGNGTMIQQTAKRISPLIPAERIMVVTNDNYVDLVKEQLPDVPEDQIIGEVVAKNTAPCVVLSAALIKKMDPSATLVVLPADHVIQNEAAFLNILKTAIGTAEAQSALVTIGIEPNKPETGFGYIQGGIASSDGKSHKVARFTEKPDLKTAESFLEQGGFFWNSGMFVWKASKLLEEATKYTPDISQAIISSGLSGEQPHGRTNIDEFYRSCPSISVDYGIMEQSADVYVVPGEFGWNDVGSWSAVYELLEKDQQGNALKAKWVKTVETENCLVSSKSEKLIATVGLKNIAVVETDNAILVLNLEKSQGVKEIVNGLKDDFERFA